MHTRAHADDLCLVLATDGVFGSVMRADEVGARFTNDSPMTREGLPGDALMTPDPDAGPEPTEQVADCVRSLLEDVDGSPTLDGLERRAVRRLVTRALDDHHGSDNTSAILVRLSPPASPTTHATHTTRAAQPTLVGTAAAAFAVNAAASAAAGERLFIDVAAIGRGAVPYMPREVNDRT